MRLPTFPDTLLPAVFMTNTAAIMTMNTAVFTNIAAFLAMNTAFMTNNATFLAMNSINHGDECTIHHL